jgi:hypothetical protein
LAKLFLVGNQVTHFSPDFLASLPELHTLGLYANPVQNLPAEVLGENKLANCCKLLWQYFANQAAG